MDAVDKALQHANRGFTIHDLNPAALSSAFQAGTSPVIFAKTVQAPPSAPPVVQPVTAYPPKSSRSPLFVALVVTIAVISIPVYLALSMRAGINEAIGEVEARRAQESSPGLVARWGISDVKGVRSGRYLRIEGDFKNNTGKPLRYVMVTFDCYDSQERKVGSAFDTVSNLAEGETWHFKATCFDPDATTYSTSPDVVAR